MRHYLLFCLFLCIIGFSCNQTDRKNSGEIYPAMPDFNLQASDPVAMRWADSVMLAMGGYDKWDQTQYLFWNFFGARELYWNKFNGDVRIDFNNQDLTILVNVVDGNGKIQKDGELVTNPDSVDHYLTMGKNIWINDSYWLVMPFKLKDSGVTLKYEGKGKMLDGSPAEILNLTFDAVGVTPDNMYQVFIDPSENLIKQWAYYRESNLDSANFIRPWDNYENFDGLLVSTDRSDNSGPRNVMIPKELPESVFTSFESVNLNTR